MLPTPITQSGIVEWEQRVLALMRQIELIVDAAPTAYRIWTHNLMEQLITATEPGAVVAAGTFTREEVLMYAALFQATLTFRDAPILAYTDAAGEVVQMTPEAIIGYRRMPAPAEAPLGATASEMVMDPPVQALPAGAGARLISPLPQSAPGAAAMTFPPEDPVLRRKR